MIDLHCHILPGLDDGATTYDVALQMARIAVMDGTTHIACTPHIIEGKYPNTTASILPAVQALQARIVEHKIPLKLLVGADIHVAWDLPEKLLSKEIPTLNNSRYFLLEPPHRILPPKLEILTSRLLEEGFIPIITHPERLSWIKNHYDVIVRLHDMGCLMQLTADSLLGGFGIDVKKYTKRMINDGLATIFASDGHSDTWRKPLLSEAKRVVEKQWGEEIAKKLFLDNPNKIIANDVIHTQKIRLRKNEHLDSKRSILRWVCGRF